MKKRNIIELVCTALFIMLVGIFLLFYSEQIQNKFKSKDTSEIFTDIQHAISDNASNSINQKILLITELMGLKDDLITDLTDVIYYIGFTMIGIAGGQLTIAYSLHNSRKKELNNKNV